tara:strand:- start:1141 stop:2253 length:1113 start_codon:yes stop_codon:yes gene_type:complete
MASSTQDQYHTGGVGDEWSRNHCLSEYEQLDLLGEGAFGWVHKFRCRRTKELFAIKKFKVNNNNEGIPVPTCREIALLSELKHDNVIALSRIFTEPAQKSLYLVFPIAENDLSHIINKHREENFPIPASMVKSFMWQLLDGVHYLHSNWIMHRDLKPSNIMVMNDQKEKGVLKIGDFGLARIFQDPGRPLHDDGRVVTVWYRAPELLLGAKHYTAAVDVWSLGCIFGELMTRSPMFQGPIPEKETKQLEKVVAKMGEVTSDTWPESIYLPNWHYMEAIHPPTPLQPILPNTSTHGKYCQHAADLLQKMLTYNPAQRITASAALDHEYFKTDPRPVLSAFTLPDCRYTNYPRPRKSQATSKKSSVGGKGNG